MSIPVSAFNNLFDDVNQLTVKRGADHRTRKFSLSPLFYLAISDYRSMAGDGNSSKSGTASRAGLAIYQADDQTQFINELLERQDAAMEKLDLLDEQVLATIDLCVSSRNVDQPAA